jgi:serine/threonine protein kinase/WD40 repeat protein
MVDQPSQVRDPVEVLAEEFLERRRRGEVPSLNEYIERYPHLAEEIRDVFPALVMMDDMDRQSPELDRSLAASTAFRKRPELRQLGDFRILREIGQGGMGIVYEARQESLGRHVALKVLPPSVSRHEAFRERFQREARAAAGLHHTNIVPIFGVGEDQGVLYYAMQFIQGHGLDVVLRDVKQMRGMDPRDLDAAEQPTLTPARAEMARSLLTGQFTLCELVTSPSPAAPMPVSQPGTLDTPPGGPGARKSRLPSGTEEVRRDLPSTEPELLPRSSGFDTHSDLSNQPEARYYRSIALLGVQAAQGLAHAHSQGILHRDVKPSNLLLDLQGTLWITDFGLAKTEGGVDLTHSGELLGTLRYMAPERFEGKADARSDLYSLGVTMYEMLTLRPPFAGRDRVALMGQITTDTPPAPSRLAPLLPRDLETIVQKAMARDPAARYATARELAEDLRRFLESRPIKARRSSAAERLGRWCRRNPTVASLAAAVALLLLVIALGSFATALRLRDELERTERAERDKTEKLWESYLAQAQASRWSGRVGRRFEGLEALRNAAQIRPDLRLRNEAIALLALPDIRMAKELLEGFPAGCHCCTFDAAFERYARSDGQGNISVRWVADDREIVRLPGFGMHASFLKFSPDSRFLAAIYHERAGLRVWDVSQGKIVLHRGVNHMDFSPDSHLAAVTDDAWVHLYDLLTGKEVKRLPVGPGWLACAFHPKGRILAVNASQPPYLQIYDLDTGKLTWTIAQEGIPVWQADGPLLAQLTPERIYLWNSSTWTEQAVLLTPDSHTTAAAFNRPGDLLASTGWDGVVRLWDPITGQQLLSRHGGVLAQFSRDGGLLAATREGSKLQTWEVIRSHEYCVLHHRSLHQDTWDANFSPDGRLLAGASNDGVHLWDLAADHEVGVLPTGESGGAVFCTDGSLITNSSAGLLRWPIQRAAEKPASCRIGPPERLGNLAPSGHHGGVCLCSDGRVAASMRQGLVVVLDPRNPASNILLRGHDNVSNRLTASPDGRWIAAMTHFNFPQDACRISDLSTQKIAWIFPKQTPATFSPDSKRMVTGGDECRVWEAGTWRLDQVISEEPGLGDILHAAFSPDGTMLALAYAARVVRLVEPRSGRELATLAAPNSPQGAMKLCFSPDGSHLAGVVQSLGVQLWDLRLIRQQLAEMGLDWELPPYQPAEAPSPVEYLTVKIEAGSEPSPSPVQQSPEARAQKTGPHQERPLPSKINLAPQFASLGIPPRAQGDRDTCSVFATTAIADFEYARANPSIRKRLSEEFLIWAADEATGLTGYQAMFYKTVHGLNKLGICTAELMPYEKTSDSMRRPSKEALADAKERSGRWRVEWIKRWDLSRGLSEKELTAIKSALANGHPVACGLRWPKALDGASLLDVPSPGHVRDGHSIVFTGYEDYAGKRSNGVFYVRNSLGPQWGWNGYGVMSYGYARAYANDALWLQFGAPGSEIPTQRFEAVSMTMLAEKCAATRQKMEGWGRGMWSRGEQLFCRAEEGGSVTLRFTVRKAGLYRVRVLATAAPDYGTIRVALDAKVLRPDFDLYSGRVCPAGSLELGDHSLSAGNHSLRFTVIGRNPASQNFFFGLDAIDLLSLDRRLSTED